MALLNPDEVVIAGGFSTEIMDYTDNIWIYHTVEMTWRSRTWMKLKHGPRFDASCMTINWNDDLRIVMAGGWNNSALFVSEAYDEDKERWNTMSSNVSRVPIEVPSLSNSLRSSGIAQLNKIPLLIGGVECTG